MMGGGLGNIGGLLTGFGLMGLIPLLILGVITWVAVEATRNRGSQHAPPPSVYGQPGPQRYGFQGGQAPYAEPSFPARTAAPQAGAIAILEERYAGGEIDREEYVARKGDLG